MADMFEARLTKPGVFVTGTDTEVGKTVVACAIAALLRESGRRVGVCKPMASGCRVVAGELVSDDAVALAEHAGCVLPPEVVNPIRYEAPLAPAAAAPGSPDWATLAAALRTIDAQHDRMIVEGIGGLLVPIDATDPKLTVLDLIRAIGYPVIVVTRAGLGTLNHTAMTVRLLRDAGCAVAGLVINHLTDGGGAGGGDESIGSNRHWLEAMNDATVLAEVAHDATAPGAPVAAAKAALSTVHWPDVLAESSALRRDASGLS